MRTTTFTVNNVSDPEPIIAGSFCREIRIQEDPGSVAGTTATGGIYS
jgi:hypothetical protein